MAQCVVIADDLTGANATGVLLKKLRFTAYTVMNAERLDLKLLSDTDCIVYPTDSRAVDAEIAYNRVYNVVKLLKDNNIKLYTKRIDSTLRGNLGSETDAFLDVAGGYMLVNTVPLHKTEVALDPKTPIHTSYVQDLFKEQSKYPVASLQINDIMLGKEHIAEKIKEYKHLGVRILIFDCISNEDLDTIADGVIKSKVPFIAVDPGTFTAALSRKLMKQKEGNSKVLITIGSVNGVAKMQVDELLLAQKVLPVFVNVKELVEGEERRTAEMNRVVEEVLNSGRNHEVCAVIGNGILPENRIDLTVYARRFYVEKEDISNLINDSFAEITYQILLRNQEFKGLYSSGGDITVAISKKFNSAGIRLLGEVVPLAAYGEFIGGVFEGLKVVTKGGMAGDKNALNQCIHYLKEQLYM